MCSVYKTYFHRKGQGLLQKKWGGYLTVEASYVMPLVLFLYLLIVLTALFLYCRCAISQDNFLLGMRGGKFTLGERHYGEVIYGEAESESWPVAEYVRERLLYKREFYPLFPSLGISSGGENFFDQGECVRVRTEQKGSRHPVIKEVKKVNPIRIIREGRRN